MHTHKEASLHTHRRLRDGLSHVTGLNNIDSLKKLCVYQLTVTMIDKRLIAEAGASCHCFLSKLIFLKVGFYKVSL